MQQPGSAYDTDHSHSNMGIVLQQNINKISYHPLCRYFSIYRCCIYPYSPAILIRCFLCYFCYSAAYFENQCWSTENHRLYTYDSPDYSISFHSQAYIQPRRFCRTRICNLLVHDAFAGQKNLQNSVIDYRSFRNCGCTFNRHSSSFTKITGCQN